MVFVFRDQLKHTGQNVNKPVITNLLLGEIHSRIIGTEMINAGIIGFFYDLIIILNI